MPEIPSLPASNTTNGDQPWWHTAALLQTCERKSVVSRDRRSSVMLGVVDLVVENMLRMRAAMFP
jgi:hypothetical protein